MADIISRMKRSQVMAAVKSRGGRTTEIALRQILRRYKVTGWRSNLKSLAGRPDFSFQKKRLAVFVDGCFWHGCLTCKRNLHPSSNATYWANKIASNKRRDRRVARKLRSQGWSVIRIWEHDIKKRPDISLGKITRALDKSSN